MHKKKLILIFPLLALLWAILSCSLQTQTQSQTGYLAASLESVTQPATSSQTSTDAATLSPRTKCMVNTGLPDGRVNLRSCGALDCAVQQTLVEGDSLDLLDADDSLTPVPWAHVRTSAGQSGYVNRRFVHCTKE
jgi:hypothetical protein